MDTIVALATGTLPSALAIIRVSGPLSQTLISHHTRKLPQPNSAHVCVFSHRNNIVDQIVSTYFEGPKSFTGEDVWEISCHGGRAVVSAILEALTHHAGVRLAAAGEFTRRAVENGKLDLLQAEGIADLIAANSSKQQGLAYAHLQGVFSEACKRWQVQIRAIMAGLEALIDFPDEADVNICLDHITTQIEALSADLSDVIDKSSAGQIIRDGVRIALIGAPNVGKSSLLNALLVDDRAIVTEIAGTTRDYIEGQITLGGYSVSLFDTAGLRQTKDTVERLGIDRSVAVANTADIRVFLSDNCSEWPSVDMGITPLPNDIFVSNKIDLITAENALSNKVVFVQGVSRETIRISALTGEGLPALRDALTTKITAITTTGEQPLITRARHDEKIRICLANLNTALGHVKNGSFAELIAEDIRDAYISLDELIGRIDSETILGQIFNEFCIGK